MGHLALLVVAAVAWILEMSGQVSSMAVVAVHNSPNHY